MDFYGTNKADMWAAPDEYENYGYGYGGNDRLTGGADRDILLGGTGSDTLQGGTGDDLLHASDWDDPSADPLAVNHLSGGTGSDQLIFGYGDVVDGGAGWDQIGIDLLGGAAGVSIDFDGLVRGETVSFGGGTVRNVEGLYRFSGTAFGDMIRAVAIERYGDASVDLYGNAGDDTIVTGIARDHIEGGAGDDIVNAGDGANGVDGGDGNDKLSAGSGNDTLSGGAGADTISGGAGNDQISGGQSGGNGDRLSGGDGDDYISMDQAYGGKADIADGGAGDDRISLGYGDIARGGAGYDIFSLSAEGAAAGLIVDTTSASDNVTGFEAYREITGSAFGDRILLSGLATVISDDDDADRPRVEAGRGDDLVAGSAAGEEMFGEEGRDTVDGGAGSDTLSGGDGDDIVRGGAGNDEIAGDDGADRIDGGMGDDIIDGGAGADRLVGGEGNDVLITGEDYRHEAHLGALDGGGGDDTLLADWGDAIAGGEGTDTLSIYGSYSDRAAIDVDFSKPVTVMGGAISGIERIGGLWLSDRADHVSLGSVLMTEGVGRISGWKGNDTLDGGSGGDTLWGDDDNDVLSGNGGNDELVGGDGADRLTGGDGDDFISGGDGPDMLSGGAGRDTVSFSSPYAGQGVTVDLEKSWIVDAAGNRDAVSGFENVVATAGVDKLFGTAGDNIFYMVGQDGGGFGSDIVNGRGGNDTLSFAAFRDGDVAIEGVVIDLMDPGASSLRFSSIENVVGGSGNNMLSGTDRANYLEGDRFRDQLSGRGGNDTLVGGDGGDRLDGGTGQDRMEGGDGDDTYYVDSKFDVVVETDNDDYVEDKVVSSVSFRLPDHVEILSLTRAGTGRGNDSANTISGSTGDDRLFGEGNNDDLIGDGGNDYLDAGTGGGYETLEGGDGDDTLVAATQGEFSGGLGHDVIRFGGTDLTLSYDIEDAVMTGSLGCAIWGNDARNLIYGSTTRASTLYGFAGNDTLVGGTDADQLLGGDGADRMIAGSGGDRLYLFGEDVATGGKGADVFVLEAFAKPVARITDYSANQGDVLDFSWLEDDLDAAGVTAIAYLGTDAFTGHAGEARTELHSGYGLFMFDLDGDKTADLTVRLDGLTSASAVAYVL